MPAYIRRPHDELLRAVLDPAVPASRLVVVRGGSSTGKTRAAYEAVADRLADWRLDYPLDPGALAARLEAGIPARTVLWLGELRQYADADGGAAVLGRLADLLEGEGHLVITTVWPEHWTTYTAAARAGPGAADPAGTAGRLLSGCRSSPAATPPGSIRPAAGSSTSRTGSPPPTWQAAARTGDPLLAEAAAAAAGAGQDGQVTQYLAGVPDLLRRYAGPGGDPYGQAVITAAMDATRLGHASPLPAALLQEAAVGYLTGPQRTKDIASWRDTALAWATEELKGAVRALQPVPPASGTGVAGYQVADYLDQHGRRTRQDQLGPPSLWDALTAHAASASDLTRLGQAARDRGLYRHAAALWTTAATLGSTDAATPAHHPPAPGQPRRHHARRPLGRRARQPRMTPGGRRRAAGGAAQGRGRRRGRRPGGPGRRRHASLDDPRAVAELLGALQRGRGQRRGHRPGCPGRRPRQPRRPGGRRLAAAGAARGRGQRRGRRPGRPGRRPRQPRRPWARRRAAGGAARGRGQRRGRRPAGPRPRRPRQPRRPGGRRRAAGGAARGRGQRRGRRPGRPGPAAHASLDDPRAVADLLGALREAGASDAVAALLARDPAAQVRLDLDDPGAVAALLGALRAAGASDAVTALAARAAGQAQPRRPAGRRLCCCGRCAGPGPATRSPPWPPGPPPGQPRRPGGRRRAAGGAARGRGQRRGRRPG